MARSTYDDAFNGGNSSARGGELVLEDALDPNSEMASLDPLLILEIGTE